MSSNDKAAPAYLTHTTPYTPGNPVAVEQHTNGWIRSGFNKRRVFIQINTDADGNPIISVEINEWKGDRGKERCYSMCGSLNVPKATAELLASALKGTYVSPIEPWRNLPTLEEALS